MSVNLSLRVVTVLDRSVSASSLSLVNASTRFADERAQGCRSNKGKLLLVPTVTVSPIVLHDGVIVFAILQRQIVEFEVDLYGHHTHPIVAGKGPILDINKEINRIAFLQSNPLVIRQRLDHMTEAAVDGLVKFSRRLAWALAISPSIPAIPAMSWILVDKLIILLGAVSSAQ